MAHTKSALKDIQTSRRTRDANKIARGTMKSAMKKFLSKAETANAEAEIARAMKLVDKAAKRGVIHKNAAARRKSQLDRKLNALRAASQAGK